MNTPTIETESLILRKFTLKDIEAFFTIMNDDEVNKFLPWFPLATIKQAEHVLVERYINRYEEPIGFYYAICLKSDNIPIGYVNVSNGESHDFGYGLKKEFWNKGIMTEACKRVLKQLEEASVPFITATHDINNFRSGKVLQKIGMTYCYSYEEQWQPKDILVTFRMYQLNFDIHNKQVYQGYLKRYPVNFVEENI